MARYLRCVSLAWESCEELADLPREPSRGDRRTRFLCSPNHYVPASLLPICHPPWAKQNAALQRDPSPHTAEWTLQQLQAPWQNGLAEQWVGSCRRELLDHIVAINETHLRRLLGAYEPTITRNGFTMPWTRDTPNRRAMESRPSAAHEVISMPRLGGLHHRYTWRKAA